MYRCRSQSAIGRPACSHHPLLTAANSVRSCTSTGRKCDGYVLLPRKKRAVASVDKNPSFIPDIGPDQLRAIDYFHHKTAPGLASYFDAEFWTRLVVQMSYVEPTIRHAIVALGSLHEQRESSPKRMIPLMGHSLEAEPLGISMPLPKRRPADENPMAIAQYNKAISHLSQRLVSEGSVEVTLLACILFICVEFLRGDAFPAVTHFKSGMGIAIASITNQAASDHSASQRIREHILPFLNRIELLSMLFGNDAPWEYPVALEKVSMPHVHLPQMYSANDMSFRRFRTDSRTSERRETASFISQISPSASFDT